MRLTGDQSWVLSAICQLGKATAARDPKQDKWVEKKKKTSGND